MHVAVYARVSTNRHHATQTIDQQIERLRQHVAGHPDWQLADDHIFRDDGYSGAHLNRPGLDRLREQARAAAFEQVLITAPDRLARMYVHQVLLIDELTTFGCTVEFLERPMTSDPHDQLVLQIRGAVAEYERKLISDRMRRGRRAKVQSGQLLPWTYPVYGYLLDPERPRDPSRVHVDPIKAALVQQIFARYTDPRTPMTLYKIAKWLMDEQVPAPRGGREWSHATVRNILSDTAYIGVTYSGRIRMVPGQQRQSALRPRGPGSTAV
jgi:site-specific DNA recombinase